MLNSPTYNIDVLNELFTSREIEFINNIDTDIDNINSLINREETSKKIITDFINNLNNLIVSNDTKLNLERACKLAFEAQDAEKMIDDNINVLQINKQTYDQIKQSIINLLVSSEADSLASSGVNFSSEIINLRNNINTFYDSIQRENLRISLNQTKVNHFLNKPTVKEYLSLFNNGTPKEPTFVRNIEKLNIESTKKMPLHNVKNKKKINELLNYEIKEENPVLLVSEKDKKVYLPYSKKEVLEYLDQYPDSYKSFSDVVKQEFIFPLEFYMKHPLIARFRESYSLLRDRESKSVLESLKFAIDMMSHYDINPAIIAACKSQEQLETYLNCAEQKEIENFQYFKIQFDVTPLA